MTEPIVIEVTGTPVAKGRARFASRGAGFRPVAYTPSKTRNYENALRFQAQQTMNGRPLLTGGLSMTVTVFLPIPTSWSKRKQQAALNGSVLPTKKPDLSNFVKCAEDALNCVVYCDDSQIVEYGPTRKVYSDRPRLRVEISQVGGESNEPMQS